MTEIERLNLLEWGAGAAEACIELGHPEHVRAFVVDGYGAAGARKALAGTATTAFPAQSSRQEQLLDWQRPEEVAITRVAAQRLPTQETQRGSERSE